MPSRAMGRSQRALPSDRESGAEAVSSRSLARLAAHWPLPTPTLESGWAPAAAEIGVCCAAPKGRKHEEEKWTAKLNL